MTSPTSTAANPGLPLVWAGTARYADRVVRSGTGSRIESFEGTVTWQKDEKPDPALLAGSLRYVISASQMRVIYHADGAYAHRELDTCTADGETQVALPPFQGEDAQDAANFGSYLIVGQDGEYRGEIHSDPTVPIMKVCPGGTGRFTITTTIHLYIGGRLINGLRMQGEMEPGRSVDRTLTGAWDFQGR